MTRPATAWQKRVFPDLTAASEALAHTLTSQARAAANRQGRWVVALSGGETPRGLYEALAQLAPDAMPWSQCHVVLADERCVPSSDPASNLRLVRETLLNHVPVPPEQIYPLVHDPADPEGNAVASEAALRALYDGGSPRLDMVLLGLGDDGHTASLFPHSPLLLATDRWVAVETRSPKPPPVRLTLTLPVLLGAAAIHFLVSGEGKAEAVRQAWDPATDPQTCPAAAVRPPQGHVTWWLDHAAAGALTEA
jgi:6-phosphogluconolactonase